MGRREGKLVTFAADLEQPDVVNTSGHPIISSLMAPLDQAGINWSMSKMCRQQRSKGVWEACHRSQTGARVFYTSWASANGSACPTASILTRRSCLKLHSRSCAACLRQEWLQCATLQVWAPH